MRAGCRMSMSNFYPRPPRGGRPSSPGCQEPEKLFLSTPSARRATFCFLVSVPDRLNFYPRPPRGGRLRQSRLTISDRIFLSTPSARRATNAKPFIHERILISIHALREEGDASCIHVIFFQYIFLSTPSARRATKPHRHGRTGRAHFYPRPPRGGRQPLSAATPPH